MTPLSLQISTILAQTTASPSSRNISSRMGPTSIHQGVLWIPSFMDPDHVPTLKGGFTLGFDYQRIFKIKWSYWSRAHQRTQGVSTTTQVPGVKKCNGGKCAITFPPKSRHSSFKKALPPPRSRNPTLKFGSNPLESPNKGSTKEWHMLSTPSLLDWGDHNGHPLTRKHTHMWWLIYPVLYIPPPPKFRTKNSKHLPPNIIGSVTRAHTHTLSHIVTYVCSQTR